MKPGLDEFLAQLSGLLNGQRTAREVEAVLGPSASGTARLGLYATLVQRQQAQPIDEFYAAVRVAAQPGSYPALRDAYLAAHPPSHWQPARAAEHFPAFLEQRRAPPALVELADFAWTRHLALSSASAGEARGLVVRHYTFAVKHFSNEVERDGRSRGEPAPHAETWLLGRSVATESLVLVEPSLAALVVVEVLQSGAWSKDLPELSREALASEADALRGLGLLSPRERARLEVLLP